MSFHPSVAKALSELKKRHPKASLAAFGQTVFWDEPMKSVLIPMLESHYPEAKFAMGTHDADYFGRCPGLSRRERFVVCDHNDGATRGIWAAVAEASALFGAEVVPTHAKLAEAGVELQKLSRAGRGRYDKLIKECTTAWGWRGVAESGDGRTVFRDVATPDALPAIDDLLTWALDATLAQIDSSTPDSHQAAADDLLSALRQHAQAAGNEALTDLYQSLWPYVYQRLLGHDPKRAKVTSTCKLFQFNRRTCMRPRFRLVRHFLNPKTASVCREAYSASVAGSGIYELERFGGGALPFDLVVPGRGRGTISLSEGHLVIDTEPHIVLDLPSPVRSVRDLAAVIEDGLGPDVALVGKAVALAFMFTSEFVFVLNEEGSTYVRRTREMARQMANAGIPVQLHPVLRLRYDTWSSLKNVEVDFRLPEHLAAAFGAKSVSAKEFAGRWKRVVKEQEGLLKSLKRIRSPQGLMELLSHEEHPQWLKKLDAYVKAHRELLSIQKSVDQSKHRADALRQEERSLKADVSRLQRLRGKISRIVKPLRDRLDELKKAGASKRELDEVRMELACYADGETQDVDAGIKAARDRLRQAQAERKQVVREYRRLESGPNARDARKRMAEVEAEAEAARLVLATHAIRTTRSLRYTNHRPTAWWLPVVDPGGKWYQAVLQSTQLSVEEMS